ncbi:MAG: hypothetical protein WCD49_17605 [Candidatus Acidiferrales bacterium]
MPKNPHDLTREENEQEKETRQRFESDAIARQSNVLPLDAARNEGRFYGTLIRGKRPFSGVQRIGFFFVGSLLCWSALFTVMSAFPGWFQSIGLNIVPIGDKSLSKVYLPFAALALFAGLKIIASAVAPFRR